MDYEKKYKEALAHAREIHRNEDEKRRDMEWLFPELKESEDERIRKAIHIYLDWLDGRKDYQPKGDYTIKDMIAWLEKQGEQKPADKVEPFDKYEGLTDFERTLADICIGWIGEELGWKQYIKDNADVLLKIAVEKFNSVQDVPFEQKPAWSEEDDKMLHTIIADFKGFSHSNTSTLESHFNECITWLKSLKPQNRWKPSDEQIEILDMVLTNESMDDNIARILRELREQLKKLKE